ncbi:hypothetical protein A4H97_26475 [Niastella yeongjuensis]|uniref:Uncharacterized protein n=1 Tax=Niastella yeongjuensis TaxID=354355 RepID=A0A1V9F096_9BACT|nr:hypothetical protein [Niastella yeongjuensis]OQP51759.1 hypothetical protein A4H97_26475 [Niastella yeongjuensis]SEP48755.1 hypothetical protein SAMN05660816_06818 [Niastella yeongjuensis]
MPKSLPLTVISLVFCVSCTTTFQYATLSSPDVVKNDRHEFVVENDSLKLTYNFSGHEGPIHVSIQNKMGVPVYVDWQRSAIIVDDKPRPYMSAAMKIEGNVEGNSYRYGANNGQLQATAVLPSTIDFIPPRAIINKNPMRLSGFYGRIPDSAFHKLKYTVSEGVTVKAKKATFTEATSPLRFRSYITYMVGETGTKPLAFESSFFVSEIMNTGSGPIEMSVNNGNHGDQYYNLRY